MMALKYDIWGYSDVGRARDHNEDALYFPDSLSDTVTANLLAENGQLMAIADGVGGAKGGERASRLLIDNLTLNFYQPRAKSVSVPTHLLEAISTANTTAHTEIEIAEASTTLVAAAIHADKIHIAHVGDSRAYLIRNRELHQLTQDHAFGNRLLRYLVSTETVEAELHKPITLRANDQILLCSDGLYREIRKPREVVDILAANSAEEATYQLIDLANLRGGHDNISVIIIRVKQPKKISSIYPSRWESI